MLLLSVFKGNLIFSTDFRKKSSNIDFHENPSNGSLGVPCGLIDMTNTTITFRRILSLFVNFCENSLKNESLPKFIFPCRMYVRAGNGRCWSGGVQLELIKKKAQ